MTDITLADLAALARTVSAPIEQGDRPFGAYVTLAGRKIAVEVAFVPGQRPRGPTARLRDDRVARRVLSGLEAALEPRTPDGRTVILTLGAPIKVPNRTLAALSEALLSRLAAGDVDVEERMDILGNRVRFRILGDGAPWTSTFVGFVFSGDPSPGDLVGAMRALHQEIVAKSKQSAPDGFAGARWLVLAGDHWVADSATYRRALSRLSVPDTFETIVMMVDGGRIEVLVERRGPGSGAA